ncbi:MAG: DNA adenine methylase [Cytophagaceae bacterium]|nr:DNA adenine methylase [Cytophagaceae bacterium]
MGKVELSAFVGAKPFLKWAGGKTQLLGEIRNLLPLGLEKKNFTYVEPFVGSGAVLFWMLNNFPNMKKAVINDINSDLINTYNTIKYSPEELIIQLKNLELQFHSIEKDPENKKEFFYHKRTIYNTRESDKITQAALFIFLNRTCFNGLYRVNRNNGFNVPMGSYKKPTICDASNIRAVSEKLKNVEILCGDYQKTIDSIDSESLFYFDPPYKPLNETSSFNSYSKDEFDDQEQIRLRDFCIKLDKSKHIWILSNSDVDGIEGENKFFDELYNDFNILRVKARRNINANSEKRGELNELLITNQSNLLEYV